MAGMVYSSKQWTTVGPDKITDISRYEFHTESKYYKMVPKCSKSYIYCKVASSNTSRLEAHAGFFRLLMKVIFDPYVL